ncbi:hypothetical protein ACFLTS_03525 [Chloroflexota bacterium]
MHHHHEITEGTRLKNITRELKSHAPFTALGALTGIVIMVIVTLTEPSHEVLHDVFHTLHPIHVVLSAIVTTAIYRHYQGSIWVAVGIGLVGSIAICSISDVILPYLGGRMLGATMSFHLCLVEHPWLVLPGAFVGVAIGLYSRWTKFPHFGHVLISTWASLFYMTAFGEMDWLPMLPLVFIVLFIAVWIPCCTSDIVFPLLFRKGAKRR